MGVVVQFSKENDLDDTVVRTFVRQLQYASAKDGSEPVRRALTELAMGIVNGRQPDVPAKLPNYFAPILDQVVENWRKEEQQRLEQEAREQERRERLAQPKEEAEGWQDTTGLSVRFKQRISSTGNNQDEATRRALLLAQAASLKAGGLGPTARAGG